MRYVDEEENVSTQSASESSKDSTDNSMNKPANTHTPDVSEEVTEDNSFEDLEDDENGMGWVG